MPTTARSKRKPRAATSAPPADPVRREEERLISRIRGLVAEARRLGEWHVGAKQGAGPDSQTYEFRRRVLLMKQETEALIRKLEAARDGVGGEIKAMTSQAVAISAYTQCRRAGQQYAREVRRRK